MRKHLFSSLGLVLLLGAGVLTAACSGGGENPTAPTSVLAPAGVTAATEATESVVGADEVAGPAGKGDKDKQDICHLEGNGSYHLINVSSNAVPAHLAHGDVMPVNGECPPPVTGTVGR